MVPSFAIMTIKYLGFTHLFRIRTKLTQIKELVQILGHLYRTNTGSDISGLRHFVLSGKLLHCKLSINYRALNISVVSSFLPLVVLFIWL
jgi:hypothetical protein